MFNLNFSNQDKNILITGAGFIGTNLIKFLYKFYNDKINIVVVDNLSSSSLTNIDLFINKKIYFYKS